MAGVAAPGIDRAAAAAERGFFEAAFFLAMAYTLCRVIGAVRKDTALSPDAPQWNRFSEPDSAPKVRPPNPQTPSSRGCSFSTGQRSSIRHPFDRPDSHATIRQTCTIQQDGLRVDGNQDTTAPMIRLHLRQLAWFQSVAPFERRTEHDRPAPRGFHLP